MSKPVRLSSKAYAALVAHKRGKHDSLSQVVLRFVPRPIRTFGDLKRHLEHLGGPVNVDYEALERVRRRRQN